MNKPPNKFSNMAPPTGYVPGAGRGAIGFTTRSDIGSAAAKPPEVNFGAPPANYVAGRGYSGFGMAGNASGEVQLGGASSSSSAGRGRGGGAADPAADRSDYSESLWDANMGYGGERLFARDVYEEDDAEADKIYDSIDDHMEGRHKRRREREEKLLSKKSGDPSVPSKQLKITERFSDLKRELAHVTVDQWEAIPEVGDHSLKFKQKREKDSFSPLPDSIITASLSGAGVTNGNTAGYSTSIDSQQFTQKLDKMSDSVMGQTVVDPKGYLTSLSSVRVSSDAEVGDIKKARLLLNSVTTTNPKHPPGWIAAALVEEVAGKMVAARKIIMSGCEACPDSEDLWIEAARLHDPVSAKAVLAQAVRHIPTSVKIWLKAAELEPIDAQKKIVLRRALEFIPNSVILWKTAIQLENVNDAKIMLARAVECVPNSVEMWLALAKLESHENARKVLNQARAALPTEPATWITAAKLEEAHGNLQSVPQIIKAMLSSLNQYQVAIDRDAWIKEAHAAEYSRATATSAAIIKNTLHIGVDEEDRVATYMDDAEGCMKQSPPAPETARAIYSHALSLYPSKMTLWLASAMFEKTHGTGPSLESVLRAAVQNCPHEEVLWLMAAKEKWLEGNVSGAREVLKFAFEANPASQQVLLAAAKLEWENNEPARARALLLKARDKAPSERVWLKSALLELEHANVSAALSLLDEGINRYPSFAKFYIMAGQCVENPALLNDSTRAREYYQSGLKTCSDSVPLWILMVRLEERIRGPNKSRSMLELARLKMPSNDVLWLEAVRLERRAGNDKLAESLIAKALQQCPTSGILWAEDIMTCPKPAQRSKSVDALQKVDSDPYVVTAVARLFEKDRKFPKARKWFERAVALDPKVGDSWVYFYCFELCQRADQGAIEISDNIESKSPPDVVVQRCSLADPNRGELWCSFAKRTELRREGPAIVLRRIAAEVLSKNVNS